jgi:hypothetical protein
MLKDKAKASPLSETPLSLSAFSSSVVPLTKENGGEGRGEEVAHS